MDAETLPAYAAAVRARYPSTPPYLLPQADTLYVQYLRRPQRRNGQEMLIVAAVMDVRTHALRGNSERRRRRPPPAEINYIMGLPANTALDAAWCLWDAVLWHQVAGVPASSAYLQFEERARILGQDEWATAVIDIETERAQLLRSASPSVKRLVRGRTVERTRSPPRAADGSKRKRRSASVADKPADTRGLRQVLDVERDHSSNKSGGPRSEQTIHGITLA
jgi:hypothetical protein